MNEYFELPINTNKKYYLVLRKIASKNVFYFFLVAKQLIQKMKEDIAKKDLERERERQKFRDLMMEFRRSDEEIRFQDMEFNRRYNYRQHPDRQTKRSRNWNRNRFFFY
jgi:hypothetical protein